ncbi:hypothetical protein PVK06_011022 [Gossypium arboreum]|uniref:Bidirectional sugar transporter SWEET n=1 Tax=Gossypium arboreum TaxID=29729 RepID=A0ABR0Q824_GOSAR|nr:hypothetical protein PVK06_011022 [Gossypium arboreum]
MATLLYRRKQTDPKRYRSRLLREENPTGAGRHGSIACDYLESPSTIASANPIPTPESTASKHARASTPKVDPTPVCNRDFETRTSLFAFLTITHEVDILRPTFVKIYKKKAVEEFKPDPYIATAMNCMLWIFYGLPMVHPDSVLVVTINSIGLAMELIYLSIFFLYAPNKGRAKVIGWLALEILFLGVVAACTLTLRKTHAQRSDLVGILCAIFGVLMYASPLTIMRKVIKTKSVKYMPFYLSLANFLNGVIWVTYALIRFDLYILIGNGLGALSGAIQLILYACYFKSALKDDDENDVVKPSELQLSGSNGPARPTV